MALIMPEQRKSSPIVLPLNPNPRRANIHHHIHGPTETHDPVKKITLEKSDDTPVRQKPADLRDRIVSWIAEDGTQKGDSVRSWWHVGMHRVAQQETSVLFMTTSTDFCPNTRQHWDSVQVVCQTCMSSVSYRDGLLSLHELAEAVFAHQPLRLFLHGLYLRDTHVERWAFDRSGMYCLDIFDVGDNAGGLPQLLGTLSSYSHMSDKQLGRSILIQHDDHGNYVAVDSNSSQSSRLYIHDEPLAADDVLVGPGTTCYLARTTQAAPTSWTCVVKFKWRLDSDYPEEELLSAITETNPQGVISLDSYKVYPFTTTTLRRSIYCGLYRRLDLDQVDGHSVVECTKSTELLFENRTLVCIVTKPAGRRLKTYKSRLELLLVLRDAIKAHRSLFQEAHLIHQDISISNIIIVDAEDGAAQDATGFLIDLDAALPVDRKPTVISGTRPFMAIEILQCRPRTYRHDLESFLYVLLYMLIMDQHPCPPSTSLLHSWSQGSWRDSADQKMLYMTGDRFPEILAEFPCHFHCLKELAEGFRAILFPVSLNGKIWTGANEGAANKLYDNIIGVFEEAITRERAGSQVDD